MAAKAKTKETFQQRLADSKDVLVREISAGISHDFKYYENWHRSYFDDNPVHAGGKWNWSEYKKFDADPHIYNCFSIRKEQYMARQFYVRSADRKSKLENKKAATVFWVLDHIKNLAQKKREMLTAIENGYSMTEMIFGRANIEIPEHSMKQGNGIITKIEGFKLENAWIVEDLKTRLPSAFDFDAYGNISMLQVEAPKEKGKTGRVGPPRYLTEEESAHFLVLSHDQKYGNRRGWPLKSSIFYSAMSKRAVQIYQQIFAEKYGMPYLLATYDSTTVTDSAEVTAFYQTVMSAQKNSVIVAPKDFTVSFLGAIAVGRGASDTYSDIITRADGNISEVILGHREAVTSPSGAFASAELKEAPLRHEKLKADATNTDALFNDYVIPLICDANFIPNGNYPYVVTDIQTEAEKTKMVFIASAVSAIGLPVSKSQLWEVTGLQEPIDDDDALQPTHNIDPSGNGTGGDNMENVPNSEQIPEQAPGNPGSQKKRMSVARRPSGITMNITL